MLFRRILADRFRARILSGDLGQGERLPSTRQIAAEWKVATGTAEGAVALLRDEGMVRPRPGRGGTVVEIALPVSTAVPLLGNREETTSAQVTEAPEMVARELAVRPGSDAVRRQGLFYRGKGVAGAAATSWWPGTLAERTPALRALDQSSMPTSLLMHVGRATGRRATRGRDYVHASSATSEESGLLGLPEGRPVLRHQTWIYDQDEHVLEYAEHVTVAAEYEYNSGDPFVARRPG